jgi:lipopolysaccharide transport system ATP-binding protein
VASLLEAGMGFHLELTGRENVFLSGAVLGMSRAEIRRKFDEIVAFSEVEGFLDTPIKHYSTGMYIRLAFAVAAHLEPEILIVDEVLAVGRCGLSEKVSGQNGRSFSKGRKNNFFVSHNMQAIAQLTDRAILLNAGKLQFDGSTAEAIAIYNSS